MSRIYNFSAGPSILPLPVLEEAAAEFVDYGKSGMSLIEMSHRGKIYSEVNEKTIEMIRKIFGVPDTHKILFLGGGATLQFSMVPMNLLKGGKCDFTLTGSWAKKAYSDAVKVGTANVVFDGKADNYSSLPDAADINVDSGSAYLHMTSNETIGGIQWKDWPDTGNVPIVCDMSSDILSRSVPFEKFGLIYAGAQKNLGPAGVALVIIREDVLESCSEDLTAYLSYKVHAKGNSLYNTPPVFCIYMIMKVLEWLEKQGGLSGAVKMAEERSGMIYGAIDGSGGYYRSPVAKDCRSLMNIVWRLPSEELEKKFISEAASAGMAGLKGHRSVGGCRASVYNAMPVAGAKALADFMADFAAKNG